MAFQKERRELQGNSSFLLYFEMTYVDDLHLNFKKVMASASPFRGSCCNDTSCSSRT